MDDTDIDPIMDELMDEDPFAVDLDELKGKKSKSKSKGPKNRTIRYKLPSLSIPGKVFLAFFIPVSIITLIALISANVSVTTYVSSDQSGYKPPLSAEAEKALADEPKRVQAVPIKDFFEAADGTLLHKDAPRWCKKEGIVGVSCNEFARIELNSLYYRSLHLETRKECPELLNTVKTLFKENGDKLFWNDYRTISTACKIIYKQRSEMEERQKLKESKELFD